MAVALVACGGRGPCGAVLRDSVRVGRVRVRFWTAVLDCAVWLDEAVPILTGRLYRWAWAKAEAAKGDVRYEDLMQ